MSMHSPTGRRSLLLGGGAAACLAVGDSLSGRAFAGAPTEGPWAVELFTSQGCSSCPPADALLGRLARRPDIVAVSYHVDYWDYIGWKDPFATRATTERQRAYVRALHQRYVYTPQMVVEGMAHDSGRDPSTIERLLDKARRRAARRATPELARGANGALAVRLDAFPLEGRSADVTLLVYDRRHSTPVASGENQGRMLENFNVVRRLQVLGRWDGAATGWTIDDAHLQSGTGAAVIVQHAGHGPVIGCNKIEPMVSG
ncbi:DUF1223 domain-containing protein [Reyranella sp.]|uniref:DUF1223 domain-containing protein n=1 Tax=Reyranella sp. TaxID=1929291 RepID=UPI003BA8A48E